MTINILAIGDVVGPTGLAFLKEHLKPLQKLKGVSFTVVNGENANVVGITPTQADAILAAGADVVTLGNHTWTRWELQPYLDEKAPIARPETNCSSGPLKTAKPSSPRAAMPASLNSWMSCVGIEEFLTATTLGFLSISCSRGIVRAVPASCGML